MIIFRNCNFFHVALCLNALCFIHMPVANFILLLDLHWWAHYNLNICNVSYVSHFVLFVLCWMKWHNGWFLLRFFCCSFQWKLKINHCCNFSSRFARNVAIHLLKLGNVSIHIVMSAKSQTLNLTNNNQMFITY